VLRLVDTRCIGVCLFTSINGSMSAFVASTRLWQIRAVLDEEAGT
jgi:hypothetical protein